LSTLSFKDHSASEYGLIVTDIGRRQKAEEQIDTYAVPYRNGKLHIHSGTYNSYSRSVTFGVKDKTRRAEIYAWLTGSGVLQTSDDSGGYFNASVVSAIDVSRVSSRFDELKVTFEVDPFFYLDSGNTTVEYTTSPQTFTNPGTVESAPYIKITGSGAVTLTVGETIVSLTIDDYLEIDSQLQVCYRDTVNKGDLMVGEFPTIPVGESGLSWDGTVTKVEIKPRWCES